MSITDSIDEREVIALTRSLVQFKTVNPPGNEEDAVHYLGAYLARAGLTTEYQQVAPGRANLIARLVGRGEVGHLVLSGHMDVVPADGTGWDADPFAAELHDGRLIGRGTADMKGGLAAMAVALATLARIGFIPRGDLILTATSGEELGMIGARHLVASGVLAGSAGIVIGEPTGLQVCAAQKGALGYRLTVRGQAAHSSRPECGVSAISYLARAVVALETYPFSYRPSTLLGAPGVNVGTIHGGVARNIVPDQCVAEGLIRLVAGQEPYEVEQEIRSLLNDLVRRSGLPVGLDLEVLGAGPALETPSDHPLVQATIAAASEARSGPPTIQGFPAGTEAAFLCPAYQMPMVIFGPGRLEQAHGVNEYVEVAELIKAVRAYTLIVQKMLA